MQTFEDVVTPVIKWLAENGHPHMSIIIDNTHAELLEGKEVICDESFIID